MERISLSLECPICYSTLVDPRILPCAHTFCINCIVSMCDGVDDTRCPVYVFIFLLLSSSLDIKL